MSAPSLNKHGSVLIVGGGIGGMQAALDLANSGFKVHMVQKESSIGGIMAMLDKTFPTGDCSMCMISPKMVEVGRHRNIDIYSCSELVDLKGEAGDFKASLLKRARYIDIEKCTGCEDCVKKCPVLLNSEFDQGLVKRTAISRRYAQAVPGAVAIDKQGVSPCRIECPAEVNAHAYVSLIARGRFAEAISVVRRNNPFPATCGRVCTHPCETACSRVDLDESVSICALKRFLTDWEDREGGFQKPVLPEEKLEKIAVVGSGPAGMTCARDLVLKGYQVTVFEKFQVAGGTPAMYIPEFRLPKDVVEKEIDTILAHDIELRLNQEMGRDFNINSLKEQGYKAVFIAIGAHKGLRLKLESGDKKQGIWDCMELLRKVRLGEKVPVGKKVVVIGGGNVAVDVALTSKRLGAEEVRMVCLEKPDEMPAYKWEIDQAVEEGIQINNSWGSRRILSSNGSVSGIELMRCTSVFDESGRFNPTYDESAVTVIDADTIIFAVGIAVESEFLKDSGLELLENGRIKTDSITLETNMQGVFAGGDAVSGPSTVIEAIAMGACAAESIDRYLRGKEMYEDRKKISDREKYIKDITGIPKSRRRKMPRLPLEERKGNFNEVELGFREEDAVAEAQRCMSCADCSECLLCVEACEVKAINHEMQSAEHLDLNVGAVILSPGLETYNPRVRGELGFGRWANVVTSLQFERILSASGPYKGEVTRPGDQKHPKKIAWLQCVGSRDQHNANPWCSSVCCMYATKQAIIAKEHDNNIEPSIFFMEMRAYGKDFDKYVERAKNEYAVRYQRAIISAVREDPATGNLILRYAREDGTLQEEPFDIVVLSVGLQPHQDAKALADICGIEMDKYLFPQTSCFEPVETSRPGVFATGIYQGPKDIPETVMQGSAVASQVMTILADVRGTETIEKELPPEKDVTGEEPRIGVLICHCGMNIASTVDVKKVVEAVKDLPGVEHAEDMLYTCSQDSQEKIKQLIKDKELNRILVASCTPRTHEPLFQETIRDAGLNKYLFDLADIREQCSWCHMGKQKEATKKAIQIVKMAIAKTRLLEPLKSETVAVTPAAMIIGGGIAGMAAALSIAEQGFPVHIVEKENELGGLIRNLYRNLEGDDIQEFLNNIVEKVESHPYIYVHTGVEVKQTEGFVGNYKTLLTDGDTFVHGVIILASGGVEYEPSEYLYNQSANVITQRELERSLAQGKKPESGKRYVMIQCVGSREEPNQYCSRICCQDAIKNAIAIKEINPEAEVVIIYRDIRTYGLREDYYKKARDLGVIFVRYEIDKKPQIEQFGKMINVKTWDYIINRELSINADWLVLSAGLRPNPTSDRIGAMYKVTRNQDGYYLEAHVKLRPVDFPSEGLYVAGLGHAPKNLDETIIQALAAAGRAGVILSHEQLAVSGIIAKHKKELCMSCLSCLRICPFDSPYIDEEGKIAHNEIKCLGCGICAGICPAKAFQVNNFRDDQILAMIDAAVESEPGIIGS